MVLNYLTNPNRFFGQIVSHKNERTFLVCLGVFCLALSICDLRNDEGVMDNRIITTIILLLIGLIKWPLTFYLIAFVVSKLSTRTANQHFTELLFRVIIYSVPPLLIVRLISLFYPDSKLVSICSTVLYAWSFVLFTKGYLYIKRNYSISKT